MICHPTKQGKTFHIELGQNNGPFKDTISSLSKKQEWNQENNANEDMQSVLTNADQVPNTGSAVNSFKDVIQRIEALININRASNSELKNAISEVKSWKAKLEGDIDTQCNGLSNDITPILKDDYCHIKEEIIKQNEENDQISKVVKNLKKECTVINQKLIQCDTRIAKLESDYVGIEEKSPVEENEF